MTAHGDLETYFREAAGWDADRLEQVQRERRIAWRVATGGWACAILASVALVVLMPLKRVDPFVVRVDNTTGIVDVVPVYAGREPMPEAITRYLLTHYVTVCERYNFGTVESDYAECGAFHSAQRNQLWYGEWNPANPASPLNLYKDGSTVRAQVSSVSFFARATGVNDLAQVRYTKAHRQTAGGAETITHWIATIQYGYTKPSGDPKLRALNPLGFKVIDFRAEPEILGEGEVPSSPSARPRSTAGVRRP